MVKTFDSRRGDFTPYGFSCESWMPARMSRPDRHNEIELNFIERGTLTYLIAGVRVTIPAGRVGCFWAAIPHQIVAYEGDAPYVVVTIPLAWFLQWRLPRAFVQAVLAGRIMRDGAGGEFDRLMFGRWVKEAGGGTERTRRASLLEIEARVLRMASGKDDGRGGGDPIKELQAGELSTIERVAAYLSTTYTEPITLADVGREGGLHPNYAAALFKETFGTTIHAYLTQHRVSHAQRLLATTDRKVLDIALESGFNSLSRFNAAFRKVCGSTPRAYRADCRRGVGVSADADG
jgi:AraC-like DNA-binding protein